MFPNFGITDKVTRRDVSDVFLDQEFLIDNDDDVVKMGVVYLLSCYLFGFTHDKKVDNFLFGVVNGDDYLDVLNGFAFGKMLWERTFYYLTIAIQDGNSIFDELEAKGKKFKKYKLPGFVVPFHVWLYEIIPSLSLEYCVRKGSEFRRILNWQSFEVIVDDIRLTDAERHNRLLKNFKFQPVYLPKSVDDEKDFEEKFENICRSLSFIKDSQICICNEMTILRDEFSRDLAKLSGMIEKMNSKNHKKIDTINLFGAFDREAYYRDLSDNVGGLELSVHSVKFHENSVDYSQYYLSPYVMKVVDNTIKDVLCSKDQPSCEKNNNMEMVVFDDSYQMAENLKRIRKESAIVLSPFITDFGSSDSGKDSLMNILVGDKLIVDGLNPFKNEIGDNNTNHVLIIVHVKDQSHWILIHFSIKDRMLNVYNFLSGLRNQNKALSHVKAYSVMLPYFLEFLNFYASRPDLSMEAGPYSVGIREPLNYTFIQKKR
uniref:Ubiquitin-like protease family profile domain-containing protein n=1 Tax=Cannabis sativa TaxID=3483 RepID=A0A803NJ57_CANSA